MAPTTAAATRTPTTSTSAVPLSERCWSGCGLPCQDGVSMWHARLVGGWPFYAGTDAPDPCSYWGLDFGRTHCGCWGLDLYYRMSGCKFPRSGDPTLSKDGGRFHHMGGKLTYERSLGNSKFYVWGGLGAGYFVTDDYVDNDTGFEFFGELGVGYILSRNWRVRAGVNVHAMDTDVGREFAIDDNQSRWLYLTAAVIELEFDF